VGAAVAANKNPADTLDTAITTYFGLVASQGFPNIHLRVVVNLQHLEDGIARMNNPMNDVVRDASVLVAPTRPAFPQFKTCLVFPSEDTAPDGCATPRHPSSSCIAGRASSASAGRRCPCAFLHAGDYDINSKSRQICFRHAELPGLRLPLWPMAYGRKTRPGRCTEQELIALRTLMINQAREVFCQGRFPATLIQYVRIVSPWPAGPSTFMPLPSRSTSAGPPAAPDTVPFHVLH
jgi:hypothetical protein